MSFEEKIADHLLARGLVSESRLLPLLAAASGGGSSLEEAILKSGAVDAAVLNGIKAEIANVPPADLSECFHGRPNDLLPAKMRRHYKSVIFYKAGNKVKIGMVNPWDFEAHEALAAFASRYGYEAQYFSISLKDFIKYENCLENSALNEADDFFHGASTEEPGTISHDKNHDDKSLDRLLRLIMQYAIEGQAIKIHLEGDSNNGRARFRVGNMLYNSLSYPASAHRGLMARLQSLIGNSSGRCRINSNGADLCLSADILPFEGSEKAVLEVLDLSRSAKSLRSQGFSLTQRELIKAELSRPGIIIVSASDDSARKEALYGLIGELDANALSVSTIESQITHKLPGVNQSAISPITQSRSAIFAALLDHDADVIMSDEIDDEYLLSLAESAARMGKKIILGVKADSLREAIQSIWKISGGSAVLMRQIRLALEVRKVKRICRACVAKGQPPHPLMAKAKEEMKGVAAEFLGDAWAGIKSYQGKGCPACSQTGDAGSALIAEIWPMKPDHKEALISSLLANGLAVSPSADKYATIIQDGLIKASYGLIAIDEAFSRR